MPKDTINKLTEAEARAEKIEKASQKNNWRRKKGSR